MTRGGKQPGGGRPFGSTMDPKFKRVRTDIRLPRWMMRWLKIQRLPASRVIEKALIGFYDLRVPKRKGELKEVVKRIKDKEPELKAVINKDNTGELNAERAIDHLKKDDEH